MSKSKSNADVNLISPKELVRIYARLHAQLSSRVKETKRESRKEKNKNKEKYKSYIDASKDLYAYVRLMELCQALAKDVEDMHTVIHTISKVSLSDSGRPN